MSPKTVFVCQECGYESPKWMGQCICGQWNTMVEERPMKVKKSKAAGGGGEKSKPIPIQDVQSEHYHRMDTGIGELNRVLGGGLVRGSVVLISGEPGIGKSTLILQVAAAIANKDHGVLYVTGEESEEQIKLRADRIHAVSNKLMLFCETNIENILVAIENLEPDFLIVDSIQTVYSDEITSAPGTISQVRDCTNQIIRMAKTRNIPVFIIAHVTKSGELAGPRTMEHMVDAVLHFTGERNHEIRILRSYKNRYGTTSEIGAFEMNENGLSEFDNLSQSFLEGLDGVNEGSIATAVFEGSRAILLEVQALAVPANVGFARRTSIGIDASRLNMIIAVLEKKTGISLINYDIYINIVGGIKPEGTATDLAVAIAIYSSYKNIKLPSNRMIAFGEIGLTGELRPVQNAEKMIHESLRMGFDKIILPHKNYLKLKVDKDKIHGVTSIVEALRMIK
ncbi:MAG: DNA repair protein RadA [Peptostreptococcales bacterium]